jgi:type IV secretory pathway component VirB8
MSRRLNDGAEESYVKTYAVDVNTSRTPGEGAHSPSWPNELIIIIIILIILIIIIVIIIIVITPLKRAPTSQVGQTGLSSS